MSYNIEHTRRKYNVQQYNDDLVIERLILETSAGIVGKPDWWYRIEAICMAADNSIIVVAEGRHGGWLDFRINELTITRSTDYGKTFSEPEILINNNGVFLSNESHGSRVMNPGVIVNGSRIYMFHTKFDEEQYLSYSGAVLGPPTWYTYFGYIYSDDNGVTWSEIVNLNSLYSPETNAIAAGPGNGIVMEDGTMVVPFCDYRHSGNYDPNGGTDWAIRAGLIYSTDNGVTWQKSNTLEHISDESAVVEYEPGKLIMYSRGTKNKLLVNVTDDLGATWVNHATNEQLTGGNCQVSVWKYIHKGVTRFLLAMNETIESRKHITLRKSSDLLTWDHVYSISNELNFGYTGMTSDEDGRLFAVLEHYNGIRLYDLSPLRNSIIE